MSTVQKATTKQYNEAYVALVTRQKAALVQRHQQSSYLHLTSSDKEEELVSMSYKPINQPKKLKIEDALPMSDEDFLIAELNGHFE